MRKLIVGGNWKCNGSLKFLKDFPQQVLDSLKVNHKQVEVVVAPTSSHIYVLQQNLKNPLVQIAAQNISQFKNGAYTGEISAEILNDFGVEWTILGHSERRHVFGESDKVVGEKVKIALDHKLKVMACIGEKLDERESGRTREVNERQLNAIRELVPDWSDVVIAYEPVWAIGTGKTATPEQAQETHEEIREWIAKAVSKEAAETTRIMYGGSVTDKNANDLI